jgi:ketosteroid isomerase-like protein
MFRRNRPPRLAPLVVVAVLGCAVTPSVAVSQIPGGSPANSERWREEFKAAILGQVRPVIESWQSAWHGKEGTSIESHYAEDGVLAPPGGAMIGGRDDIADFARSARRRVAGLDASMLDFDAADGLAYLSGTWNGVASDGSAGGSGRLVTMLVKTDGTWLIRSQLFAADSLSAPLLTPSAHPGRLPPLVQRVASDSATLKPGLGGKARRTSSYHDLLTVLASLRRDWTRHDAKAVRKLMTDDATLQPPGWESASGSSTPKDLGHLLREYGSLNTAEQDFEYGGTLAYLSGRYYVEQASGPARSGNYIAVFRNLGSGWLIRALLFL